jgi:hypothetical protein
VEIIEDDQNRMRFRERCEQLLRAVEETQALLVGSQGGQACSRQGEIAAISGTSWATSAAAGTHLANDARSVVARNDLAQDLRPTGETPAHRRHPSTGFSDDANVTTSRITRQLGQHPRLADSRFAAHCQGPPGSARDERECNMPSSSRSSRARPTKAS